MTSNPHTSPIPFDRSLAVRTFLGPLQPYLDDPAITELAIVRAHSLFARTAGQWVAHNCNALTPSMLAALINALVVFNGLGTAPIISAILPDGQRCQIVQPPACLDGSVAINIRKHAVAALSLEELQAQGALSEVTLSEDDYNADGISHEDAYLLDLKQSGDITEFLHEAIQRRRNIVVAGATGSGKTTFARSLIARVPTDERLITIEDVHELALPDHANRVHLMYGSGSGRVSATECIGACMRLSPDRIFLTELRGPETWDYLAALNTGHPGSVTTTHANSAADAFDRLAVLIKQSPSGSRLDLTTIQHFLAHTVDVVVFLEHFRLKQLWFTPRRRTAMAT
ncbi:P-type DNA transfer ATPase VirB11 [Zwartia vadi]|uniref:P-type DNA transfer ATPase VirB11 n=1 Tax=Zwartia vadi TaxID=3058168 RepID=UPI0025B56596|nr:P-type DNA transfer ATPase VirB11 [Zwartia vadi]MDN3988538.1 P-type DNA transfer ATPase VirB11 [Zwartia vadi]